MIVGYYTRSGEEARPRRCDKLVVDCLPLELPMSLYN